MPTKTVTMIEAQWSVIDDAVTAAHRAIVAYDREVWQFGRDEREEGHYLGLIAHHDALLELRAELEAELSAASIAEAELDGPICSGHALTCPCPNH